MCGITSSTISSFPASRAFGVSSTSTRRRKVADFNPVNWAVVAGRSAVSANADWALIAARAGFLGTLLVLAVAFATRAFHSYQRSV